MKATVVIDNIANGDIKGEWGLCIYIEYDGKTVLLDTGGTNLFLTNMEKLGLDIKAVDYCVMSHGHYDHTGGMRGFFEANPTAKVYLQDTCGENCYFKKWVFRKYVGLSKHILTDYKDRIEYAKDDFKLYDGVYLIPHKTPNLEKIGKREMMYQKTQEGWKPDNFSHEQSLVFETEKGLVVFNSCSHGGAANIVREVEKTFPGQKVYALIGGFHLVNKRRKEVLEVGNELKNLGVSYVCTGHCTKGRAYGILKEVLGDNLHQLHVGKIMEF